MKPMLPTLTFNNSPEGNWSYEIKYDGFRAILYLDKNRTSLISRNGKELLAQFPEIRIYLENHKSRIQQQLPLILDCELVLLKNPYASDFAGLQVRGRMKSSSKIQESSQVRPSHLMVFDLLHVKGVDLFNKPYSMRRRRLEDLFKTWDLGPDSLLNLVETFQSIEDIWPIVDLHESEGIVIKKTTSLWSAGKRSADWLKYKNWRILSCFISGYSTKNGYYDISILKEGMAFRIGQFLSGVSPEQKNALNDVIRSNGVKKKDGTIEIPPGICVDIYYLEVMDNELRETRLKEFRFDLKPADCTFEKFLFDFQDFPKQTTITHLDKPLWDKPAIDKFMYLSYLRQIAPFILPFLKDRELTVIRLPHGINGESFFQKNCPDYAPDYIQTHKNDNINYILCNDLSSLIWLGNQLAIEYHIPFTQAGNPFPEEIVFDLDPPGREYFHLAVTAALKLKELFDGMNLISFVKTSGNKGLQVFVPLPSKKFTWDETRLFTEFIANYLVSKHPELFTIERLKKNRGKRLYFDYIQHAEGKTIIAPYSVRANSDALVSAPLFWSDVSTELNIEDYTMDSVLHSFKKRGCPFSAFFQSKERQPFSPILEFLKKGGK
ncbi:DNA ligase D [Falsibacillus pallidus]|uniref:DNA ligase D n=1 Tax=Falsibacillus pallidus TaxID=493781 RepID=UPI003D95C3D8